MEKYYDVVTTSGTTYLLVASSIQIKDGHTYFNNPNGSAKRIFNNDDIVTIKPGKRKYSTVAKIVGATTGACTVAIVKPGFEKLAVDLCPSENAFVKGCWKATAKVAAVGTGWAVDKIVSDAAEDKFQVIWDACTALVSIFKNVTKTPEEPQVKEVFEENSNNVTN